METSAGEVLTGRATRTDLQDTSACDDKVYKRIEVGGPSN